MIDTVLFDLDGTLLPMDQEHFVNAYMGMLAQTMARHGYEPKKLIEAVWAGTGAMVKNDGTVTNEEVFWQVFGQFYDADVRKDKPLFDEFYEKHFAMVRSSCGFNPHSRMLIDCLKEKGYRLVLATNPLFPATATMQRVRWAGLEPEDFALITTYENSWHCKPFPAYYQDILTQLELRPEQCMMVGNDVRDDMVAAQLGMQTYLLTDCLINQKNADISVYQHGSMERLLAFVQENM